METWKIIAHGALGSLTFGIWWFVITNNMMKTNNEKNNEKSQRKNLN